MKIIIVGIGKVGYTLAEQLSREHHDITVIDDDDEVLSRANDVLDIMCVRGNGASFSALREAGAPSADVVIAATSHDEINMVCCQAAKSLGAQYAIARIRDVDYTRELTLLQKKLGIDMVINPEQATAVEISRLLHFPSATNVETFYRGKVELVGFRVQTGDFLTGKPLSELSAQVKNLPILICAAEQNGKIVIPNGSFVPQPGDKVYVMGQLYGVNQFFKLLGRYNPKVRDVIIVGGGRISHYLTTILEKLGMRVKIIELNEERCRELAEMLPHSLIIHGDGTDQELLESENFTHAQAFVALTDRDEDNLIISMYALLQGLSRVVAKSNRQNYSAIAAAVGIDSIISPKLLTANSILQVVRGMQNSKGSVMTALYRIADNQAEAAEFVANQTTRHLGIPLKDLPLKKGVLIAVIASQGKIIIPEGSSVIHDGDTVIIVSADTSIMDINDIYDPSYLEFGGNNEL